jgi:hypothetical protein
MRCAEDEWRELLNGMAAGSFFKRCQKSNVILLVRQKGTIDRGAAGFDDLKKE